MSRPAIEIIGCKKTSKNLCECKAISDSGLAIVSDETGRVSIPPNAGITKILASVIDSDELPVDGGIIQGGINQLEFIHVFGVNPVTRQGEIEINFEQPLCVGEEGTKFLLRAFRLDGGDPIAALMTITVVYCPDFCKGNNKRELIQQVYPEKVQP
jgi:hypothetical protein